MSGPRQPPPSREGMVVLPPAEDVPSVIAPAHPPLVPHLEGVTAFFVTVLAPSEMAAPRLLPGAVPPPQPGPRRPWDAFPRRPADPYGSPPPPGEEILRLNARRCSRHVHALRRRFSAPVKQTSRRTFNFPPFSSEKMNRRATPPPTCCARCRGVISDTREGCYPPFRDSVVVVT